MNFAPSVYEHSAKFINKSPWEVSRNAELIFKAHLEAYRVYKHNPIVVGVDIYNLEAEAYGAKIEDAGGNETPAVLEHICSSVAEISQLSPFDPEKAGRIPIAIEAAKRLKEELPDADIRIPVSGPFSIASLLLGFDSLLCETIMSPEETRKALEYLAGNQANFCREIIKNGLGVAFFESAAAPPLMSPETFREIELPPLKKIIKSASEITGRTVPCIIGGNTFPILDEILSTGTGYVICPYETDQKAFMEKMREHPEVMTRINMSPKVMTQENDEQLNAEISRVLELAQGREKACIGTGGLAYDAIPENVLKAARRVSQVS
jgi:uroporphyrinogen decarboxylase